MQAIIKMSLLPPDEALHLCRQPAPISLFTIHYESSTLICLILISLCLEDLFSLCEFGALDLTPSFPGMCRNPHCHPAPNPAQSEGKKKENMRVLLIMSMSFSSGRRKIRAGSPESKQDLTRTRRGTWVPYSLQQEMHPAHPFPLSFPNKPTT